MRTTFGLALMALTVLACAACDLTSGGAASATTTIIQRAKAYAQTLASPPRIYHEVLPGADVTLWPDQAGSTTTTYSQCPPEPTITPAFPPGVPTPHYIYSPDPCGSLPMTLTTVLMPVDANTTDIVFESHWLWARRDPQQHSWQIRVQQGGAVTLVREWGDVQPYISQ